MKKFLAMVVLSIFLGGVLVIFVEGDNPATETEMVKKQVVDMATAEFIYAPEAVSVEFAVYYPPMIEETPEPVSQMIALCNSPPTEINQGKYRIRADT